MSVFVQDEEAVVDVEVAGKLMIQDILRMTEPRRTYYIKAWIDYGQYDENGGMVKLRNPERKRAEIPYGGKGKKMVFPFTGKQVARITALDIIRNFGPDGYYRGIDMATGMSRESWEALKIGEKDIARQYKEEQFHFDENYLEQVPYGAEEEVIEETDLTE